MKTTLLTLLLIPSINNFAQRQGCLLHIISHARTPPSTLTLLQPPEAKARSNFYTFTDSSVIVPDSIDHPLVITLLIEYQGQPGYKYRYPVFLMPGELFVQLDQDHEDSREYVDGPPLSHDFTALLELPVAHLNRQIGMLKHQLDSARQTKGDTTPIKEQLTETAHQCWGVPRAYIRSNPASPLCLTALEMMGTGDPTLNNPAAELDQLFRSLTPELRNSPEGKKYALKLEKLSGI